jgi:hypothetical protein
MQKPVLGRYATTAEGEIIIDVAASRVQDLYNDFDRNAPYVKRDLDQDFSDYLLDCAREIGRRDFVIRITLGQMPSEEVIARVRQSIHNYFCYLGEMKKKKIKRANTTSLILLAVGLSVFSVVMLIDKMTEASPGFLANLLIEGLTVAAWVSLWEALATFLIRRSPFRKTMELVDRLANAPVSFASYEADEDTSPKQAPRVA